MRNLSKYLITSRAAINKLSTGEVGSDPRDRRKVADAESQNQQEAKPTKRSKKVKKLSKKKKRKSKKVVVPVYEVEESSRRPLPELKLTQRGRLPSLKISTAAGVSALSFAAQMPNTSANHLHPQSERSIVDGGDSIDQTSSAGNYDLGSDLSGDPPSPSEEELGYAQGQSVNEWVKSTRIPPPSVYEKPIRE